MGVTLMSVPIGTIIDYAGAGTPDGYLSCDGQAVSRATYAKLFDAIGTAWGAGDGSTTFNVPKLQGRATIGAGTADATGATAHTLGSRGGEEKHTLVVDEIPSHPGHLFTDGLIGLGNAVGKFIGGGEMASYGNLGRGWNVFHGNEHYPAGMSRGGGAAHSIMQPFATVRKLIRAA